MNFILWLIFIINTFHSATHSSILLFFTLVLVWDRSKRPIVAAPAVEVTKGCMKKAWRDYAKSQPKENSVKTKKAQRNQKLEPGGPGRKQT